MRKTYVRLGLASVLALAVSLSFGSSARADLVLPNGNDALKYFDYENLYRSTNGGTSYSIATGAAPQIGDILQGVFVVSTVTPSTGLPYTPGVTPGTDQITGVFSAKVLDTYTTTSGDVGLVLAPNGAFSGTTFNGIPNLPANAQTLNPNTMIAFFSSAANNFLTTFGANDTAVAGGTETRAQGIANTQSAAAAGQLVGSFGYGQDLVYNHNNTSGNNLGNTGVGYQFANDLGVTPAAPGINFYLGFQLLNPGVIGNAVPQTNPNLIGGANIIPPNSTVGANNPFQLVGTGNLAPTGSLVGAAMYDVFSNDPVHINAVITPEPSTAILAGIGLGVMGMLRFGRRLRERKVSA